MGKVILLENKNSELQQSILFDKAELAKKVMRRRLCEVVGEETVQEAESGEADAYEVGINADSAWAEKLGEDYDWKIYTMRYMLVEIVERDIKPPVLFVTIDEAKAEMWKRITALVGEEDVGPFKDRYSDAFDMEVWIESENQNYSWKIIDFGA